MPQYRAYLLKNKENMVHPQNNPWGGIQKMTKNSNRNQFLYTGTVHGRLNDTT